MRFLLIFLLRFAVAKKNLRKATINDASLCDDPDQAGGRLHSKSNWQTTAQDGRFTATGSSSRCAKH